MAYVSCFSGIGGLEGTESPSAVCEIDTDCRVVLRRKFPNAAIYPDINGIGDIPGEVVVGGWPCQDLSVAGLGKGLAGDSSVLFYAFVKAAERLQAETIVAENVPNLLTLARGEVFREVLRQFADRGYPYCSWRTLDAQHFGLPHARSRVFLVASTRKEVCFSLFRDLPEMVSDAKPSDAAGFYWTAGEQSICYSAGFVPTIKVGSGLSIPSPPAVHYGHVVRKLTPWEALDLQGFDCGLFDGIKESVIYRMAGNAVAVPVGRFVVDGVMDGVRGSSFSFGGNSEPEFASKQLSLIPSDSVPPMRVASDSGGNLAVFRGGEPGEQMHLMPTPIDPLTSIPDQGFFDGLIYAPSIPAKSVAPRASNLIDFLDIDCSVRLSERAASGLLRRLDRSGLPCPTSLRGDLLALMK